MRALETDWQVGGPITMHMKMKGKTFVVTGGGSGLSLPALYASVPIYYAMGLVALAEGAAVVRRELA